MTAIHRLFATFYHFYLFHFAFWELREDPHPTAILCQRGHHLICEGGMGRRILGVYLLGWVASSWVVASLFSLSLLLSLFFFLFSFLTRSTTTLCCVLATAYFSPTSVDGWWSMGAGGFALEDFAGGEVAGGEKGEGEIFESLSLSPSFCKKLRYLTLGQGRR